MNDQQAPILTDDEIRKIAVEEIGRPPLDFNLRLARRVEAIVAERAVEVATAELREELAECEALRERMAGLLTGVADAIRGKPEPLKRHGWQDLPERAQALMAELASARADEREAMKPAIIKALQAHEKGVERGGCFDETLCVSDDDYEDVAEEAVAIRARGEA